MPVPRPRLAIALLVALIPLALGDVAPVLPLLSAALVVGIAVLAVLDWRGALPALTIRREADPKLSIAAPNRIRIAVTNPLGRAVRLALRDQVPASFRVDPRRFDVEVPAGARAAVEYTARPRHRGTFRFGAVHVRTRGPLDLVERQRAVDLDAPANVYPDLREVRRYELALRRGLAYAGGQRPARMPGSGTVFERLREYGQDDDPRSISWTATARRGHPVTVEYETERQQRILLLLDAGRMMSSTLADLTKLDHAVNAALLLSYVATSRGDEVGLLGFSDTVRTYVPPRRGHRQFLRLTEELRRIEVTTTETDYRAAFELLRAKTSRRALVILFTDLVDDEASRSLVRSVTQLAGSNLVLCCLLADPLLQETAERLPDTTTALYERVVAREVRDARARALALLRKRGVHVLDSAAERLTVASIDRYLELTRRLL